jgi:hypothetical protein
MVGYVETGEVGRWDNLIINGIGDLNGNARCTEDIYRAAKT